jgi:hypothetical protein
VFSGFSPMRRCQLRCLYRHGILWTSSFVTLGDGILSPVTLDNPVEITRTRGSREVPCERLTDNVLRIEITSLSTQTWY